MTALIILSVVCVVVLWVVVSMDATFDLSEVGAVWFFVSLVILTVVTLVKAISWFLHYLPRLEF